jgi:dUTP pyrophosphatase
MDLHAAITQPLTIAPLARVRVPTGLAIALPQSFEGQVRPRSGLAARTGLTILNSPGTIDSDYRGEVAVLLVNVSDAPATIAPLERIAQLVIAPVARAELVPADELDDTERGEGGYGSTGSV